MNFRYRKMIYRYRKLNFRYRKLIFRYPKLIFDIEKWIINKSQSKSSSVMYSLIYIDGITYDGNCHNHQLVQTSLLKTEPDRCTSFEQVVISSVGSHVMRNKKWSQSISHSDVTTRVTSLHLISKVAQNKPSFNKLPSAWTKFLSLRLPFNGV